MALMDKLCDRLRDPAAFKVRAEDATSGGLEALKGSQYALLVTFRKNGKLVPSPVWLAVDSAGRGYLATENMSGKVKRIRNDPEVLVAASTMRGRPKGPVLKAQARVLPKEEWSHAEDTLVAAYGIQRKVYSAVFRVAEAKQEYVEITPGGSQSGDGS
jgi:PPOX class probable F420-dependent enzyme